SDEQLKNEAHKLVKYFLASLTVPENELWVNLSPYEKNKIVTKSFGLTEMGRDLLAEDYTLKQMTASLMSPDDKIGHQFWTRIYKEVSQKYGTTNIPVNTFNKVWIVPDKAVIYENTKTRAAFVSEASLKVMLEEDYLALQKHNVETPFMAAHHKDAINRVSTTIARDIILPKIEKEVNEGQNFAQLRQIYYSLILATWYKKKIRASVLDKVYADKNKVAGIGYLQHSSNIESIYQLYLTAFKKGVYSCIKEDVLPATHEVQIRKYFSGGENFEGLSDKAQMIDIQNDNQMRYLEATAGPVDIVHVQIDMAMTSEALLWRWERFMGRTDDRDLWGKTINLTGPKQFEMGDLISGMKFARPFRFPGQEQGKRLSHGMGEGVLNIKCVSKT
ncbi:MAG: hypothetical protein HQL13_07495, partial [Candidatus Omnitrophica bacterium]|nr:hypothetical protein [Candidatus Omnitrophota bacterium]